MIVYLKSSIGADKEKHLRDLFVRRGVAVVSVARDGAPLLVVVGRCSVMTRREVGAHPAVSHVVETDRPYKLASRRAQDAPSLIRLSHGVTIGGKEIVIMAGPCSVETKANIFASADAVKSGGCHVLRGGAFKPRTAPYDFQGLGKAGLRFLKQAADAHAMPVITEILDVRDIELVEKFTDIFQVGTRNMQNYGLLRELGKTRKPVLLKRGMWATYKELLLAAEYVLIGGNPHVILCERGIRTFVPETRFTLDLTAVAYLKHETHLPVVVDPSHGTGRASLVRVMSRAAIAAGADGLLIEAHISPASSISDADQAISMQELEKTVRDVRRVARAVGRM